MQLQSLRLFMAVAATGGFKAAAQQRHTVQSNVTAHIKKLETELSATLFHRNGAIGLTPAGRELLGYAERTLAAHDAAVAVFKRDGEPAGELRVGSMESTAAVRLPALLAAYHARYPAVALRLTTGTTADLLDGLLDGTLDCAFIAGPTPDSRLHTAAAFDETLVLVSDTPRTALPTAEALLQTPFLAFRQGCHYRHCVERLFASAGVYGGRIFEFGSIDSILGCVAAGMGHALLPQATVAAHQHRFDVHYAAIPDAIGHVVTRIAASEPAGWSSALAAFHTLTLSGDYG